VGAAAWSQHRPAGAAGARKSRSRGLAAML